MVWTLESDWVVCAKVSFIFHHSISLKFALYYYPQYSFFFFPLFPHYLRITKRSQFFLYDNSL